jgi:myo-inositol 2-dehydrogenase / D-chiro-inositol 1-dehydrogenase
MPRMNASDPDAMSHLTRRNFLRTTTTAVGATLLGGLGVERAAHAAGNDTIKVALIGCGGRGTGAASQALHTNGPTRLVAMADTFGARLKSSLDILKTQHGEKVDVPKERQFLGFDGYKLAIAQADVVLLTSPPGFRPAHYEEAVRQGKHVFMEKPLATDSPGIRRLIAANQAAKEKGLKVAVGFQRHHQASYIEALKRIHDGAIGDILMMRVYWRGGSRGGEIKRPGETEIQYQIRNWYFFTYLSGDHIVEQHVHNIDVANWIKGAHPIRAHGIGGRQVRTTKEHGQIFDHHSVEFEYADGTRLFSQCTQIPQLWTNNSEHALGSKGSATLGDGRIFAITGQSPWRFPTAKRGTDAFQQEHDDLFDAIRNNKTYNEADHGITSTMTAIMGRMATYSGKLIEWENAFASELDLVPKEFTWEMTPPVMPDADGFYPVALPGQAVAL